MAKLRSGTSTSGHTSQTTTDRSQSLPSRHTSGIQKARPNRVSNAQKPKAARKPKIVQTSSRNAQDKRGIGWELEKLMNRTGDRAAWERQYYQGKSISDLPGGTGCGFCLLSSPRIPSQAPINGKMRFELMSGDGKETCPSLRLCGPENYYGPDDVGPIFLLTFLHMEQIIVVRNLAESASESEAYQIIIVPTAATGSSSILRSSPEIISFSWPNRKANKDLGGIRGEKSKLPKDTYLSVFKHVFDEQLATLGKSVVGVDDNGEIEESINCSCTLRFRKSMQHKKNKIQGHLYLLGTGILFLSNSTRAYLPFASFAKAARVVLARDPAFLLGKPASKDQNGEPVSLELHGTINEPFYQNAEAKKSEAQDCCKELSFTDMPVTMLNTMTEYLSQHEIEFESANLD